MKKLVVVFAALIASIVLASTSSADTFTFTDTTYFDEDYNYTKPPEDLVSYGYGTMNKLDGPLDYVQWTHHFEFNPPDQEVLSGNLTVYLRDDSDPFWQPFEFALGWAEDWSFDFGEVDTGEYSYSVTASYLEDGAFTVTIASLLGDFYIDRSDLNVTYSSVPIPSSVLLLGAGLLGLIGIGFRRKTQ